MTEAAKGRVETALADLGIVLPTPVSPVANYVPFVISGNLLFISGQICAGIDGKLTAEHRGKLGGGVTNEAGYAAAQLCAVHVLAQARKALGDLDRITRCVKLNGFINCVPTFETGPAIMNGASDLMVKALGDAGRHSRSTIGVAALPNDAAVEIDAVFEIR